LADLFEECGLAGDALGFDRHAKPRPLLLGEVRDVAFVLLDKGGGDLK
jgi:hypothetical protein